MATETPTDADPDDLLGNIELDDDNYTVVQSLFRNKYKATDAAGTVVLRGKQKMLKMKEEFPFTDDDGNPVFTVKAGGILDVAGNYALIDEATGDSVLILDKNFTLFHDVWKVRDPDTESIVATIESKSKLVSFLRGISSLFNLIPHKYEITDADGNHVGSIDGQFSFKDKYEITIDDADTVPKEGVLAAAMVIDAIEGN